MYMIFGLHCETQCTHEKQLKSESHFLIDFVLPWISAAQKHVLPASARFVSEMRDKLWFALFCVLYLYSAAVFVSYININCSVIAYNRGS